MARVETICNNCGFRTQHVTTSRAYASLTAHEAETNHDDQMLSSPSSGGWVRFRPLNLKNATLGRADG